MATKFITKGKGQGRKVIPIADKVAKPKAKPKISAETKMLMKSPLADEFDIDVVKAVTDEIGNVYKVTDDGEYWTVMTKDGKEYKMFEDEDSAEAFAVERVKDDIEEQPEIFTRDWLMGFVDEEGLRNSLEDGEVQSNQEYVDEIEDEADDEHGNRLKAELIQRDIIGEDDEVTDEAKQEMVEQMTSEGLKDPMEYLIDQGYEGETLMNFLMPHIDVDEASQDAVDTDGIPHFLAGYDGEQVDTDTGHVLFRIY